MAFHVSLVRGEVNFEALPVAKITNYPLEKADYKPFAQASLCISKELLWLRMWAFEVYTSPQSELRCVLYPFKNAGLALHIIAKAVDPTDVTACVVDCNSHASSVAVSATPHNGEDLQGVYWGAQISLKLSELEAVSPMCSLTAGEAFPGNFYKLRNDENYSHMGSFAPADFPDKPFGKNSMDSFVLISY